ncbi:MAG: potassium-transporting ATPase subunit KdpA [Cyanobacteria bacterium P01_A01_bin.45]
MIQGFFQIALTLLIIVIISPILGKYIARVFMGKPMLSDKVLKPVEHLIYKLAGVDIQQDMNGWQYIRALLVTNLMMGIIVYLLIISQGVLPLNPQNLSPPNWHLTLHTTISFLTNTGQQHYAPENTLSYLTQTAGNGFLMFTSAATGLCAGIAFIRGLTGKELGNFYVDITRGILRILLPISIVGAIALLFFGVPQTLDGTLIIETLEGYKQYIARGPVASFEMIKLLGDNAGGFFTANSAHPFENPNGATNLIEIVAMAAIPSALFHTYGVFAKKPLQAWLLFWMACLICIFLVFVVALGELGGNPIVNSLVRLEQPNLEGKEVRFGWAQTALWAVITTATMCGAVNSMHDSLMPTGGFATLSNMFLKVIWGGQGVGIAYLLTFLILTAFLSGLIVGKTPEFLRRKIEKREVFFASIILLIHPLVVLIPAAITLTFPKTLGGISTSGFHTISQVFYEFASAGANNGSGFESLNDNTLWWNLSTSVSILLGRYLPIIGFLLLAQSMTQKIPLPKNSGQISTESTLFTSMNTGIILVLGFLTFFPILLLGPIAENLKIAGIIK